MEYHWREETRKNLNIYKGSPQGSAPTGCDTGSSEAWDGSLKVAVWSEDRRGEHTVKYNTSREFVLEGTTQWKRPFREDLGWCIKEKGAKLTEKGLDKGCHYMRGGWKGLERENGSEYTRCTGHNLPPNGPFRLKILTLKQRKSHFTYKDPVRNLNP